MHAASATLPSFTLRAGHPDFLDLPWSLSLENWHGQCPRLEQVVQGQSRHAVVFVNYDGVLYGLKELPAALAEREYGLLREMEDLRLPAVHPVGFVDTRTAEGASSILITRYLERCLPYGALFMRTGLARYRDSLLDAMAGLLIQLHLAGVFWGDCSLYNTLYRRDAGMLSAYLVDAETAEVHPSISKSMRAHDLEIMHENVCGGLADLMALGALPREYPLMETGEYVRQRYEQLWDEVTREEVIPAGERFRIQDRVRKLNALGFSVDQIELRSVDGGEMARFRPFVADRSFHRNLLHGLTGLDVEERQARQMINEIEAMRADVSALRGQSVPLSVAGHHWLQERYLPIVDRLRPTIPAAGDGAEAYCQLLEHKWYLSERAQRDVGHDAAAEDYLNRYRPTA
jgi:hypothetical protein